MWDGFAPVDKSYGPILYEGAPTLLVEVTNAGPEPVRLQTWQGPVSDGSSPVVDLELRRGNIRLVAGTMIRASLHDPLGSGFAAVGWRLVR